MRTQETVTSPDLASLAPGVTTYEHNALNQMTSANGTNFTYDDDGNMTAWSVNGVAFSATFDAENRMTSISGGGHSASFTYGPDGLAAKQVVDGVETRLVRAGYLIIEERNENNAVTRSYVWDGVSPGGIGGLLEMTQGGAHFDYLYDGKGNVAALIDEGQDVVAAYRYDSFGSPVSESLYNGFTGQSYQFSTMPYLAEFYIVQYKYRDLVTPLGRWAERDPAGEGADVNLYRAMGNDAVNLIDPFGLQPPEFPYPVIGPNIFGHIVQENVKKAERIYYPGTFKDRVENKGPWDYKQMQSEYQDFGNYNYGATGAATGLFTLETLLREAGRAQKQAGTSKPGWGCPEGNPPYGDDPNDQKWITEGWNDYLNGMYGTPSEPNNTMQFWTGEYSRCPECFDPWPY